jgi:hypothetical protein
MPVFRPVLPPSVGSSASIGVPLDSRYSRIFSTASGRWLDVGGVGELRVGHDRGGIAVDERRRGSPPPSEPAGLDAGVVELAPLADDDGAGADDEDGVDVGAFGIALVAA